MSIKVDARGLSCPQPVILVQNAVAEGKFPIDVMVDTVTARENVRRAVERLGCKVKISEEGDEFRLVITK